MPTTIILSGVPGKMAREIAALLQEPANRQAFTLAPFGLGRSTRAGATVEVAPGVSLEVEPTARIGDLAPAGALVIDYTTPDAALDNIRVYTQAGVPFVMGTTGFNREEAIRLVAGSSVSAVIAPNMAAPIVALQAALDHVAAAFPGALAGYDLEIRESHQATKKDPSGTAKALLGPLTKLGTRPHDPPMQSIRDVDAQRKLGVPEQYLTGHGWHWYEATSPASDVALSLSHRVNGRRVYAEGTLRAAAFLSEAIRGGSMGRVYTMADVLSGRS